MARSPAYRAWRCCFLVLITLAALSYAPPLSAQTGDNERLREIYEADQADRQGEVNWEVVHKRDSLRQEEVSALLEASAVKTAKDYFRAAMIFQHGGDSPSYRRAHELAKKAAALDSDLSHAEWLSAASWDRYLLSVGKPQIYGTQYLILKGTWYVQPFDTTQVTDEERRRLGVRTLNEIRARLRKQNGTGRATLNPPPVQVEIN